MIGAFVAWGFCRLGFLSSGAFVVWGFCRLGILSSGAFVAGAFVVGASVMPSGVCMSFCRTGPIYIYIS